MSFCAYADEGVVGWKILGPAFSHHADKNGAPISKPGEGVWECKYQYAYTCYAKNGPKEAVWHESNPAIGLEFSRETEAGRNIWFASVLRDSYGESGLMAGAGKSWRIGKLGSFQFEAGGSVGLWYRTVADGEKTENGKIMYCHTNDPKYGNACDILDANYSVTNLKRAIVPFVLPFVSVTEQRTGLGVNLAFVPKFRLGNYETTPTDTLMLQFTVKTTF